MQEDPDAQKIQEVRNPHYREKPPKGFLTPKSLQGKNVREVPLEMFNSATGENLISFGTG